MSRGLVARGAELVVIAALFLHAEVWVLTSEPGALEGGRAVHGALLAAVTLPLLVRRQWPLAALSVSVGAAWVQYQLGGETFEPWFAMLVVLYSVAAHAPRRPALIGAGVVTLSLLSVDVPRLADGDPIDEVLPAWFILAGIWGLGRWVRSRRAEGLVLVERAEVAEHERAEQAARAVAEERARIARELHDLVAHSMGIIVIQSQAGQRCFDTDREAARTCLASIETTSRRGLAEMRRLLGLLTAAQPDAVAPQPGLGQLDQLVDDVRAAGLPVELSTPCDVPPLPAGVDLAAYRIVQEALTNALKHAGAATARVCVRLVGDCLELEVADDGAGPNGSDHIGHGLVGMRERASLYGGTVETRGTPGAGYSVRARLPVHDRAS